MGVVTLRIAGSLLQVVSGLWGVWKLGQCAAAEWLSAVLCLLWLVNVQCGRARCGGAVMVHGVLQTCTLHNRFGHVGMGGAVIGSSPFCYLLTTHSITLTHSKLTPTH